MRITQTTLNRHLQFTINERFNELAKLQQQLATGVRLQRPSDDPVDVANALKLRTRITQLSQYNTNIKDGLAFMSVSETAMGSMNELMQRVRELALQASSDTQTTNERLYIQKEVEQLTRQLISLMNTNFKGDYVFAGTQTKVQPFPIESSRGDTPENYAAGEMGYFDATGQLRDGFTGRPITQVIPGTLTIHDGATLFVEGTDFTFDYAAGVLTPLNPALAVDMTPPSAEYAPGRFRIAGEYVGAATDIYGDRVSNREYIWREIEIGVSMPVNIPGDEVLVNDGTGSHLLRTLIGFSQALLHNDAGGIRSAIDSMDAGLTTLLSAQARNGARINRFELTLERNELQFTETTRLKSELEDTDFSDAVARFGLLETVYNAALRSGAMILQPSLANFL